MSRQFNGTTQGLYAAIDLSAFSTLSLSFWMWWDTFANNDRVAFEFGGATPFYQNSGFVCDPNATNGGTGRFNFGIGLAAGAKSWVDEFARPSGAAWHHYVLEMNRATPVNVAYVDGAVQTLFTTTHNAATYGNFSNSTLNFMSRNHASLWGLGRMAEFAIWGGVLLTAREVLALSSGYSPMRIGPVPQFYWPLHGGSPEPDYGGTQKGATLAATPTIVAHPPVRSFLVAA